MSQPNASSDPAVLAFLGQDPPPSQNTPTTGDDARGDVLFGDAPPPEQKKPRRDATVIPFPASRSARVMPPAPTVFPHPQDGPDKGTMYIPPGWVFVKGPGRCIKCGFHVPTQLHRQYCPNMGKTPEESQDPIYRGRRRG